MSVLVLNPRIGRHITLTRTPDGRYVAPQRACKGLPGPAYPDTGYRTRAAALKAAKRALGLPTA